MTHDYLTNKRKRALEDGRYSRKLETIFELLFQQTSLLFAMIYQMLTTPPETLIVLLIMAYIKCVRLTKRYQYVFFVSLKFGANYLAGQWGEFVKNVT